jgi:nitroreductase
MDTLTAIKTRRSIRNYKDEALDVNLISEIVEY